jgi:hypothetical protein
MRVKELTEARQKETNVWLHRLNKDGNQSGMRDAVTYFSKPKDALRQHKAMVGYNPGQEIAHHLYIRGDDGLEKTKLVNGFAVK